MKIVFIQPSISGLKAKDAMQPLAFAILKALTPKDIEIELYDDRVEEIPYDIDANLVGITMDSYTSSRAYQIIENFRKRGIPTIAGGYHPSLMPDEVLTKVDSVLIGDAEGVWQNVIDDLRSGSLKQVYDGTDFKENFDTIPDRSIFKGKKYIPLDLVQFGRGCRYNCDFCSIKSFYGNSVRFKSIDAIVKEISQIKNKNIIFVDDNLYNVPEVAKELFKAITPLKKRWSSQLTIDLANCEESLKLAKESGCQSVTIGFESVQKSGLKEMKKSWAIKNNSYLQAVENFRRHGIMVYGTFIFGYPNDTKETLETAYQFALDAKLFMANFHVLAPTPKTQLYNRLKKENKLVYDKWWLEEEYKYGDALVIPNHLTLDQVREECYKARESITSLYSIFKRSLDFQANLKDFINTLVFFYSNMSLRSVIRNKNRASMRALK